jgi:aminopeptidase N
MKTKFILFTLAVLSALTVTAQPDYDGCHFFRNLQKMPRAKKLTPTQQKAMQNSILRSDTIDILHYEIDIDVTRYSQQTIVAATTITYVALEPDRESILLDLFELTVDSVKAGDLHLSHSYDGATLQVYFEAPPQVGEEQELTVFYQGQPHADPNWGGFYFASNYIYNLGIGLTTVPPNFGKVWYPCFDTFVERATYTYHVTSAGGRIAVCQGDLFDEVQLGGDTLRRSFHLATQIPSYLSAIAVSNYTTNEYIHEGAYGDVEVRLAAKPEHINGMINTFQELGFAIDALEYWWGPMIWNRVGYVYTTAGALEIPTNIAYPQFMVGESLNSNGRLFSHELGHYWWGDIVTMIVHNDMWLKEGPAEYSAHLFFEWRDGRDEFIDVVKDNHLYVLEEAHVQDEAFHPMSPMPDEFIYGRTTYRKGASVLHNLRAYMGDELFRVGMQAVQENLAFSNMDPIIFRDELQAATGLDLTSYFDDQIYKPGFSTFVIDSVESTNAGGTYANTLYLQQKLRECPEFYSNVPLEVTAMDANREKHNFMVTVGEQYSTVNITTDFEPVLWSLNSNGLLNQARMDFEFTVNSTSSNQLRPFVEFRTGTAAINEGDSAFIRIEHQWAAPDNHDLAPYIDVLSSTHFWTVDGIWPEGVALTGRLNYRGIQTHDLDYDLVNTTEAEIMLLWRENSSQPWVNHPDYELQQGNLFNASGQIIVNQLLKGQYAFGNGDVAASIRENAVGEFNLYPNPASDMLTIDGLNGAQLLQVFDLNGRMVLQEVVSPSLKQYRLSVAQLPVGWYRVVATNSNGTQVAAASIEVIR